MGIEFFLKAGEWEFSLQLVLIFRHEWEFEWELSWVLDQLLISDMCFLYREKGFFRFLHRPILEVN